jgi:GrpB-like predicted nucleotidyltransferase (UPF0157 family)
MIGLERGVVRLAPYTTDWERLFEEERTRLQSAIGEHVLDIQHVGSTSIPGMTAKPIIDIAIAVESFEAASACIEPMKQIGYEYAGENGIPRRHYFVKRNPATTHHVHMLEIASPEWANHLLFRDYLIGHPKAATEYAALKLKLAEAFPRDRDAYTDGKAAFIQHILHLAKTERDRRNAP